MTRDVPHAVQPLSFMTVTLMGTIPWRSHEDSGVPGLRHRDSLPGTAQSATVEQAICGICGACASCFWASRVSFVAFSRVMEKNTSIPRRSKAPTTQRMMAMSLLFFRRGCSSLRICGGVDDFSSSRSSCFSFSGGCFPAGEGCSSFLSCAGSGSCAGSPCCGRSFRSFSFGFFPGTSSCPRA